MMAAWTQEQKHRTLPRARAHTHTYQASCIFWDRLRQNLQTHDFCNKKNGAKTLTGRSDTQLMASPKGGRAKYQGQGENKKLKMTQRRKGREAKKFSALCTSKKDQNGHGGTPRGVWRTHPPHPLGVTIKKKKDSKKPKICLQKKGFQNQRTNLQSPTRLGESMDIFSLCFIGSPLQRISKGKLIFWGESNSGSLGVINH